MQDTRPPPRTLIAAAQMNPLFPALLLVSKTFVSSTLLNIIATLEVAARREKTGKTRTQRLT
jgi:hypothetical protein